MFRLTDTIDGRHSVWTAHADRALQHHRSMTQAGLAPAVTDLQGRPVSLQDLRRRAVRPVEAQKS